MKFIQNFNVNSTKQLAFACTHPRTMSFTGFLSVLRRCIILWLPFEVWH